VTLIQFIILNDYYEQKLTEYNIIRYRTV